MTVSDDLATLRDPWADWPARKQAADRVEAEIARLRAELGACLEWKRAMAEDGAAELTARDKAADAILRRRRLPAEDGAAHDPFKNTGIEPHHRRDFHKAEDGAAQTCSECGRDLHGYRGRPRCRYCDGTAE